MDDYGGWMLPGMVIKEVVVVMKIDDQTPSSSRCGGDGGDGGGIGGGDGGGDGGDDVDENR